MSNSKSFDKNSYFLIKIEVQQIFPNRKDKARPHETIDDIKAQLSYQKYALDKIGANIHSLKSRLQDRP